MNELFLINNIQKDVDVDNSLKELVVAFSGCVLSKIHQCVPAASGSLKTDLFEDVGLVIYNAAKSYDASFGKKFSNWVCDNSFWHVKRVCNEVKNSELIPFEPPIESDTEFKQELLDRIFAYLKNYENELTYRIFEMRYLKPTASHLTPWMEIGRQLGYSHEWVRNCHDKALEKIKKYFKENEAA